MIRTASLRSVVSALCIGAALALPALGLAGAVAPHPAAAAATQTRFVNNSSYPIISLTVDSVQRIAAGQGILPGSSVILPLSPGAHSYHAANGAGSSQMYTFGGSFTQQSGLTGQIPFNNPTISQLLTRFGTNGTWNGTYFDNNAALHGATFRFTAQGTYTFLVDSHLISSGGTYTLISRNPGAFSVTFGVTNGVSGTLSETGGFFLMRNGPATFPIIRYQ